MKVVSVENTICIRPIWSWVYQTVWFAFWKLLFMEKELPKIREAGVPISFDFSDDSEDSYASSTNCWLCILLFWRNRWKPENIWKRLFLEAQSLLLHQRCRWLIFYMMDRNIMQESGTDQGSCWHHGCRRFSDHIVYGCLYRSPEKELQEKLQSEKDLAAAAEFASKVCGMNGALDMVKIWIGGCLWDILSCKNSGQ